MTKERQSHRETKKQPTMTLKEKRKAKKAKEEAEVAPTIKTVPTKT